MLAEPGRTDYDLDFEFLGFPVRISIGFWIMGVVLGYDSISHRENAAMLLIVWIGVLFVSILFHELGHALAFRRYGIHSGIVLYHFGGLAIPRGSFRGISGGHMDPYQKMIVSFAGPAFQLLLAAAVIAIARFNNCAVPGYLSWVPGLEGGVPIESSGLNELVRDLIFVNLFWALLNLLPIWPLDGGQITREIVHLMGGTIYHSSVISIAFCLIMAVFAMKTGSIFSLILLGSFAYTNYQIINGGMGRRW